jgi:hypothetical protein
MAVVDAAAPAHAGDGPVVAPADQAGAALGKAVTAQRPAQESIARAAAAEELGLDAAAADPRGAAGAEAALVGGHEPARLSAAGALGVEAQHPAGPGVPHACRRTAPRVLGGEADGASASTAPVRTSVVTHRGGQWW